VLQALRRRAHRLRQCRGLAIRGVDTLGRLTLAGVVRIARRAGIVALFVVVAMAGSVSGLLFASGGDMPQVSALDDYAPSTITRVYAADGQVVGEFATQRRMVISSDQISPLLRQAIIAAEDQSFDSHLGLSLPRIIITAIKDVVRGQRAGASTLTQQLARNLFLTNEKTLDRKIKEAFLTIQIEKRYTKREIFTLYCNHIPWGHGTYGAEAASRLYFGKSAKDLTLEEAALLAGIIQRPSRQSPYVNPEAARRRRNYALQRMAEEGFITQARADQAKKAPIVTAGRPVTNTFAPFFLEDVRQHLEERYGAKRLYESGLAVYTSLDVDLQRAAEAAFDGGLRKVDKRRGFRRPRRNVIAEGSNIDAFQPDRWRYPIRVGDIVPAVVVASGNSGPRAVPAASFLLRAGRYYVEVAKAGYEWTRKKAPDFLKTGDVLPVKILTLDEDGRFATASLDQDPVVEGALVAIDNRTGQIRAMIGGFDFARSKFNRATQAWRQMGSTFKPIVYTAAIDRGYTPVSVIVDAPVAYPAGPNQPLYSPQNYDRKFEGPVTLRHALEQSRNIPTVKLLDSIGPAVAIDFAKRFGFTSKFQPYLSLALGATEATLLDATSAYTAFPHQGVRMRPYEVVRVVDRQGNLLEENRPEPHDAIRADTAFVMTNLMRGVMTRGTAAAAAALDWPLAGKTGTMDEYTDAWFIGFDPDITIGVWIGYDEKKTLGRGETGANAALPIWIDVMKAYIAKRGREPKPEFTAPGNIVFVSVNKSTGTPSTGDDAIGEAFIAGTQPENAAPAQP
jgi:penicillin-binding protein 1A